MKTIKFNLICDGNPIRSIDKLQENFVIDDVIVYYRNGLLQRWLEVRGYDKELENVNLISSSLSDGEIIKKLISVFNVEIDESKINEGIYIWNYRKEREKKYEQYKEKEQSRKNVLNSYSEGYNLACAEIFKNPDDAACIKSTIKNILNNYEWLFQLNHRDLFYKLLANNCKLAILCLIMHEKARKYYLPTKIKDCNGNDILDIEMTSQEYKDKKEMFNALNEIVKELESKKNETLNGNIKRNDKISEGGWTPLREKDKKCMILTLKGKDLIRSVGSIEQYGLPTSKLDSCKDFAASENKFLLCDGIEYQTVASSSAYNRGLIFMEV